MPFKRQPDEILQELGIYEPDDIDLDLVAFSLGAEVNRSPLSDCEGNIIGTTNKAIITINENAPLSRQRFSLGHEIGHWVNDRGKNLTYRCDTNDMRQRSIRKNNFRQNIEVRANQFSAELMMPSYIFRRYLNDMDITIEAVKNMADIFQASLTSTAIRLVEVSNKPCMLVCWGKDGNRRWFKRNIIVPEEIWPHQKISRLQDTFVSSNGLEVDADKWINNDGAENFTVLESVFSNGYDYLSLIWWKNETQLTNIN